MLPDLSLPPGVTRARISGNDDATGVILALSLPDDVSARLAVPGGLPASTLHVTLAFLGKLDVLDQDHIEALLVRIPTLVDAHAPLVGVLGGVGRFSGPASDPCFVSVDLPGLNLLREQLVALVKAVGLDVDDTHGFTPHVTLAYVPHDAPHPLARLDPIPVAFDAVELWAGPEKFVVPFGGVVLAKSYEGLCLLEGDDFQGLVTLVPLAQDVAPLDEVGDVGVVAKASNPNERWITLKPGGGESGAYVHVKIRVNPDGGAHVIGGPGDLHGMRLTRLASKEELRERAKARAGKKRAQAREERDRAASDPEFKRQVDARREQEEAETARTAEARAGVQREMLSKRDELLALAREITGDPTYGAVPDAETAAKDLKAQARKDFLDAIDADLLDEDENARRELAAVTAGAGLVAARNVRRIDAGVRELGKNLLRELVADDDLRQAVLTGEDAVDVTALDAARPGSSPGYKRDAKGQAAAAGFSEGDAREEAERVRRERLERLRESDPERADRLERAREARAGATAAARELEDAHGVDKPRAKATPSELRDRADKVRRFLQLQQEMQDLARRERAASLAGDPAASDEERAALEEHDTAPLKGADLGEVGTVAPEFAARLEQQVRDVQREDLTRAFLDTIDEDERHGGYAQDVVRRAMLPHIGAGAHAHLSNAALTATLAQGVDRQAVDALGVEAGALLTAHALMRDLDPDGLADARAALARHHDERVVAALADATELARAARADAAEIHLPPVTGATDAAAVAALNRERRGHLARAHEALGTALGALEASAALNFALRGGPRDGMTVRFGSADAAGVATQLRALGLGDGDYRLEHDDEQGGLVAHLTRGAMDALTPARDPKDAERARRFQQIKDGEFDDPDWLPAGFERRPSGTFNDRPAVPPAFAAPVVTAGKTAEEIVREQAASRAADGWTPKEILTHLLDAVRPQLSGPQADGFESAVLAVLPYARKEQAVNKHGEAYEKTVFNDLDADAQVRERLEEMAREHVAARGGDGTFHGRALAPDDSAREALFRAVAEKPALQAAFALPGELGGTREGRARAKAVRDYFLHDLVGERARAAGQTLEEYDRAQTAARDKALGKLGAEPDKWGGGDAGMFDMFGGGGAPTEARVQFHPASSEEDRAKALAAMGLSEEHYTLDGDGAVLNDAGKAAYRPGAVPRVSDDPDAPSVAQAPTGLNPAWTAHRERRAEIDRTHKTSAQAWSEFVDALGGTKRAYAAVQERMQGELARAFAHHYGQVTGKALPVSKMTTQHYRKVLAATDPDALDRLRREDRKLMDEHRSRAGGRYASMGGDGALLGLADDARAQRDAAAQGQGDLFGAMGGGDLFGSLGGGEVQTPEPRHLSVGAHERHTLGRGVEARLAQMLGSTRFGVDPKGGPVKLLKDVTWGAGTAHVGKQRAVKALLDTGRLLGFLGVGSGKSATMLGGFTEAHARGQARKGFFVVPSIVRNQFGEEVARFTKPGQYSFHASDDPAGYAGRLESYRDGTHMVMTTHQTFRDDMIRAMAEHQNVPVETAARTFTGLSRSERARVLRAALDHHGIPLDYLAMDEAHNSLNRAGKEDSTLSMVMEAALDNARLKSLWTGSPVKNDPSEIHDWLSKVDPERWDGKRDEFMRRYGANTRASQEALKRVMGEYSLIDAVKPDVQREVTWGARDEQGGQAPIRLTPGQQEAYDGVRRAYGAARRAAKDGRVDVDALRTLSPSSFDGVPEERHEEVARGLTSALGTLKHGALARVVNEHPAHDNAKVQHVLKLVRERAGKGGVVFARNRAAVDMLREELEKAGVRVGVITGSSSTDEKGRARADFNGGKTDVILCSDAGATGANLQGRGRYLVNYDIPLTQMTLEQRNARIDRLGQQHAIELHHLITDTDHDRENRARVERKAALGSVLQGAYQSTDDLGLATYLHGARAERAGNPLFPMAAD